MGRFLAAALAILIATLPAAAGTRHQDRLFLTLPYPIEAAPSFPGGLFHWIDSLAGTSGGKTVPAHRAEYLKLFGAVGPEDRTHLQAVATARTSLPGSTMLGVFCRAATVDDALAALEPDLTPESFRGLASALAHFRPKYEIVWNSGAVPNAFLERVRRDPGRAQLERLLARVVSFYGVDPLGVAPPRLALVPVPDGYGTHAEAIGDVLLLEIRKGEGLADEASVVIHENAHFLWGLVPEERREQLAKIAAGLDDESARTYRLFGEALPTALGQGVADRAFRPSSWSLDGPWYHRPDVDACAKRIYPIVREALDTGLTLDEAFIRRALRAAAGLRSRGILVSPAGGTYIAGGPVRGRAATGSRGMGR